MIWGGIADNINNTVLPISPLFVSVLMYIITMKKLIITFSMIFFSLFSGCAHTGQVKIHATITPPDSFESVEIAYTADIGDIRRQAIPR